MPTIGRVLAISHEPDSDVVAAELRGAKESADVCDIALHAVTFDQTATSALIELMRHNGRSWRKVEFISCHGYIETALMLALSIDSVENLNLVRNFEIAGGHRILGIALQSVSALRHVRLTATISEDDASALAQGIQMNTSVETLEFRWSSFEGDSASRMAHGLSLNKHLTSIDFFGCSMDDDDMFEIFSALRSHPTVEDLLLNGNKCGVRGSAEVAKFLRSSACTLKKLDLSFQRLDGDRKLDISSIAPALGANTSLQTLDLTCNGLNDNDASLLAQALCVNRSLKELFMARNKFTDVGISEIARNLPNYSGLRKLSLWGNPFDESGARELLVGMECNMDLYDLHLFRQFDCSPMIQYFTNVNRGGRRLLHESPNKVPISLWPLALERASTVKMPVRRKVEDVTRARLDMIFCLLRGPALFSRGFE